METAAISIGSSAPRSARNGMASGMMLAGAVALLALPSAVLAFSSRLVTTPDSLAVEGIGGEGGIALSDSGAVSRSLVTAHGFRFTPAGTPTQPDRAITVAVRVDPAVARDIIVRGPAPVVRGTPTRIVAAEPAQASVQLAPSAFNLGVSRGYQSFAQPLVAPKTDLARIEMPDLSRFPKSSTSGGTSRIAPRITLDDHQPAGRAPRTFAGDPEDRVDVGGSLRVTRNLNVTAGVRYSEGARDRLRPLTDGKQDDQAVYVGTQFRF